MCTVLDQLKGVINQIDDGCCPAPCPPSCPPQGCPMVSCMPFAQVLISKPPPILAPTRPQPVVPLKLPCQPSNKPRQMTEEEALRWRYSNFYNNYNIDWHADGPGCKKPDIKCRAPPGSFTVTGENPCCSRPSSAPQPCEDYCPTGFKTCTMRLTPPPCCDPCGTWTAQIQKCPPKPRKKEMDDDDCSLPHMHDFRRKKFFDERMVRGWG
ncbi:uncharacterized protein LOC123313751 isoform X2 [Coccinella septempunctata]|uniref:uncharacterized protein LOC123313751 isoform X2 n=1 Tax=Coccinella septempunctata TaxID=41139 RepID=UPI001D076607|nr:uncharacterized protein LOC123313751 isoform X2 [Coccinella septempunctata]